MSTEPYIHHFATDTKQYQQFRPTYPQQLFEYLVTLVQTHDLAWDCGTGNGQAALELAKRFKQVIATDINMEQIQSAPKIVNVHYEVCSAEQTPIQANSVDLITVAQALHWFDFPRFYKEVDRVLKPDGVIAAWCYPLGQITNDGANKLMQKLYYEILGSTYWPKERAYLDEDYGTIPFPYPKIATPKFYIEKCFNLEQFLGYLYTWLAVKEFQKQRQQDPLALIVPELQRAWGDPAQEYIMHWPLCLLVGRK